MEKTCYYELFHDACSLSLLESIFEMFAANNSNPSTYYQCRWQQQAGSANIIPSLGGHGDQQNLATTQGVGDIISTPSAPTVVSVATMQQQQATVATQGTCNVFTTFLLIC
jgi:hypothetical protein